MPYFHLLVPLNHDLSIMQSYVESNDCEIEIDNLEVSQKVER